MAGRLYMELGGALMDEKDQTKRKEKISTQRGRAATKH
jgi:hypothetical protein